MRPGFRARTPVRWPGLLLAALAAGLLLSCSSDTRTPSGEEGPPSAEREASPDTTAIGLAGWAPEGDYWEAYRTVFVIVSLDSTGRAEKTELLYSYASPAETDSALQLVLGMRFEPDSYAGRIRFGDVHRQSEVLDRIVETMNIPVGGALFVVPVPTQGGAGSPEGVPTREESETAGLRPWLELCDSLMPGWPYETWVVATPAELYHRHPNHEVEDAQLRAAGLVSRSPDGRWGLHPFHGVPVEDGLRLDGRAVDGGFVLYRSDSPGNARQLVVGPGTWYLSAHWIDAERYVVTAIGERGLSLAGMWTGYRIPELWMGHADSMNIRVLSGPPIPPELQDAVGPRFQSYQDELYPRIKR